MFPHFFRMPHDNSVWANSPKGFFYVEFCTLSPMQHVLWHARQLLSACRL